eukprot:gnl/TRDRNA2_/TRDRNA2_155731_c1_seq1.p1 gnl/TRDRNA2_/TRDRNA2_155731_c1~~gnl/TRDRNA2_/TRDRNA2_155731_c1_seq1.p1  ORF type:complete len:149 (+),score=21.35 gnl/TRDRNA2_/TRDRNA2_155731_c1_seq1:66-449(+)
MHADFCIANVLITDIIFLVLDGVEFRATPGSAQNVAVAEPEALNPRELSRSILVVKEVSEHEMDEYRVLLSEGETLRVVQGIGVLKFQSEENAVEAKASWNEATGMRLVSASMLLGTNSRDASSSSA